LRKSKGIGQAYQPHQKQVFSHDSL
jgi:hypothetical protein